MEKQSVSAAQLTRVMNDLVEHKAVAVSAQRANVAVCSANGTSNSFGKPSTKVLRYSSRSVASEGEELSQVHVFLPQKRAFGLQGTEENGGDTTRLACESGAVARKTSTSSPAFAPSGTSAPGKRIPLGILRHSGLLADGLAEVKAPGGLRRRIVSVPIRPRSALGIGRRAFHDVLQGDVSFGGARHRPIQRVSGCNRAWQTRACRCHHE